MLSAHANATPTGLTRTTTVRTFSGLLLLAVTTLPASAADVPELVNKLGSSDNEVRRSAAKELSELGKDAKPAIKPLVKALKDQDRFVRRFAAQALGNIGPDARAAIAPLSDLIGDDRQQVREAAVKSLGKLGPAAIPALTKALAGTSSDVQDLAVTALGQMGPAGVPPLITVLGDAKVDAGLRRKALAAVLPHGKAAAPAIPALTETVKTGRVRGQDGRQLRLDAVEALGRLASSRDRAVVTVLDEIVKDEKLMDNQLKGTSRQALRKIQARK